MSENQPVFFNNENESSLMRYQLNVDETLEAIRMMLLNIKYNYKTKKYVEGTPLYEEQYTEMIMKLVKSFINKELVLSGFSHLDIYNLICEGFDSLSAYILSISNVSGVNNKQVINMVLMSILNYAFTNMKRALEYKTLIHAGKAQIKEFSSGNVPINPNMPYPPQLGGGGHRWR